jgi:cellulose synthase operon protein C
LKPKDPDSLGNLGLVRLRQGQHEQAQTLFEQAFRQTGQRKWQDLQATARFWGLLRQTDVAVDARLLDTAAELAQKAVSLQPDSPEALVALADVRKLQSNFPVSESLYQQALKQRPDHTAALKGLADVLSKQGRTAQALEWLDRAVRSEPQLAADLAYARAEMLSEQADANLQAKRPSEALRALEAAVLLRPDDPWMRHRLAKIYVQLGLPGFAKGVMDEGIERQGSDPAMRHARALVRSAVDDDRGALEDLSHIPASGRSDGMNAMVRRAVVKQMVAQAQPADVGGRGAELLQLAEQRAGGDPDLLQSVANAWGRLGKPEQGLAVVERLMAGQTSPAPDRDLLHAQWLNRARQDERLALQLPALMQRADWSDPQLSDLLAIYGEHRERLIERSQAGGDVVAAKRLAQGDFPQLSDGVLQDKIRARLLMAAAEYPDAAAALTRVLQAQPDDSDARFDLGTALIRSGRLPEAREQAEWLKANLPAGDGGAQLSLLRLWQRLGDVAQARALSEQLVGRVRPRVQSLLSAEGAPGVAAEDAVRQTELDSDVLVHAARLERSEGQYAKAMALFSDAIKLEGLVGRSPVNGSPPLAGVEAVEAPLALRLTRDAPRHLAVALAATNAEAVAPMDRIRREMDAIDTRLQSWVEVGQKALNKPSTSGISTLNGWERAAVIWFPRGYEGKYFVHIDQVQLNAGGLPVNRQDAEEFGQVAAWPVGAYPTSAAVQRGAGTHAGVGFVADRRSWDLGVTGVGFPVTNWVGGYEQNGAWSPSLGYRWGLSRRPLTGSLLSYAGARDPVTGQVWGGVVATGGSLRLSGDVGRVGVSFTARHDILTGRHVLSNQRTQLRWSADKDVWQTPRQVVNAGVSLGLTRHARDLSEYSWGHGGYYSPQRLLSLSVPAEWSGRDGAWAWLVRGALSWSSSSSAPTAFFPAHPVLQNQAGNRFYSASRGSGLGIAARAAVEHQATRNWAWGAQFELERSDSYSPTQFLLYARYLLDPVRAPLENRPRPVQLYSEF